MVGGITIERSVDIERLRGFTSGWAGSLLPPLPTSLASLPSSSLSLRLVLFVPLTLGLLCYLFSFLERLRVSRLSLMVSLQLYVCTVVHYMGKELRGVSLGE